MILHRTQVHIPLLFILLCRLKLVKAVIETNRCPNKTSPPEIAVFGWPALNIALVGILGKTMAELYAAYNTILFPC